MLDEPTTNLDKENKVKNKNNGKESLANVLISLISSRHNNSFQLIIITHDEEFSELVIN